ncbi:MAG: guanylate kinase, partial [Trinickia sp.]
MIDATSAGGARKSGAPRNPYAGVYPGNLFMVVAPSGAGKSTLVNAL